MIQWAMASFHNHTCIKFVKRTTERDFISIRNTKTGCWSYVGRIGNRQIVNLETPACMRRLGTTVHEVAHQTL
jgi:hypothetical protein